MKVERIMDFKLSLNARRGTEKEQSVKVEKRPKIRLMLYPTFMGTRK